MSIINNMTLLLSATAEDLQTHTDPQGPTHKDPLGGGGSGERGKGLGGLHIFHVIWPI